MAQITYTNKVALNENPEIADINKVTDDDMNEIKQVVNANYNNTIQITDTQPSDNDNKIWIDTGEIAQAHTEITNEYSTSTGLGYSANYVNNNVGNIRMSILWTNPNINNNISADTNITLLNDNYDYYEIIFEENPNSHGMISTGKIPKGTNTRLIASSSSNSYMFIRARYVTVTTNTVFTLGQGSLQFANQNTATNEDAACKPYQVIGYKII